MLYFHQHTAPASTVSTTIIMNTTTTAMIVAIVVESEETLSLLLGVGMELVAEVVKVGKWVDVGSERKEVHIL